MSAICGAGTRRAPALEAVALLDEALGRGDAVIVLGLVGQREGAARVRLRQRRRRRSRAAGRESPRPSGATPPASPVRTVSSALPSRVKRCSRRSVRWFSGTGRAVRPRPGVIATSPWPATRMTTVDLTGARRRLLAAGKVDHQGRRRGCRAAGRSSRRRGSTAPRRCAGCASRRRRRGASRVPARRRRRSPTAASSPAARRAKRSRRGMSGRGADTRSCSIAASARRRCRSQRARRAGIGAAEGERVVEGAGGAVLAGRCRGRAGRGRRERAGRPRRRTGQSERAERRDEKGESEGPRKRRRVEPEPEPGHGQEDEDDGDRHPQERPGAFPPQGPAGAIDEPLIDLQRFR